jgi:hypothetical protein
MSKSRSKYYDDYDEFDYRPYGRKSEYLDRKRAKRMERAMRTKDIDGMLEQNDDYDDEDRHTLDKYKDE